MKIFESEYSGEELCDVERDVMEAFDETFNPKVGSIPHDEYGFQKGTFKVTITWSEE